MIRVTEPLYYFSEPWLVDWKLMVGKAEANRISKSSMKIGSRVDELIKTGEKPTKKDKPEVHSCMQAFDKWRSIYTPLSLEIGVRLFKSIEEVEVTGEPDIFVDDVLVDIKCATKISPSYWIQVNMYRKLQGETGKVGILRLDKTTGSYEYVVKDYDPSLVNVWCGLMRAMVYFKGESNDGTEL